MYAVHPNRKEELEAEMIKVLINLVSTQWTTSRQSLNRERSRQLKSSKHVNTKSRLQILQDQQMLPPMNWFYL